MKTGEASVACRFVPKRCRIRGGGFRRIATEDLDPASKAAPRQKKKGIDARENGGTVQ